MKNSLLIFSLLIAFSCSNQTEKKSINSSYSLTDEQSTEQVNSRESDISNQTEHKDSKIDVEMTVTHYNKTDGLYFELETNLPVNFQGLMTITDKSGKIMGQTKFLVNDGTIKSEKFTIQGKPYPTGQYKLEISSPYPRLQDNAKVKEIIGKTGENLIGKNIERKMDDIFNEEYSFLSVIYIFSQTKQSVNESNISEFILRKGEGNNTTYIIEKKGGKFFLTTKVNSPHMSEFTTTDELVKVNNFYVRKSEMENPTHKFLLEKTKLKIFDSYGEYASLEKENK